MDQHDNHMLSEFDYLLAMPPSSTVNTSTSSLATTPGLDFTSSSFPLDFWGTQSNLPALPDTMSTLTGLGVDFLNPSSQTGLSQSNLAVFHSLFATQENGSAVKPESSGRTATASSRPRFAPPKGPRKQHRTGFRQLPGANGVVKRGRPSKKEYKLAGVEVDMYALKGVTLNGPVKSLAEIQGGEVLAKPARRSSRRASHKSKSSVSGAAKAETALQPSIPAIQEEPLAEQTLAMPHQCYQSSQDMSFSSTQGTSDFSYSQGGSTGLQYVAPRDFLTAFQAVNDEIAAQLARNTQVPSQQNSSSQWDSSLMLDPGFQPVSGFLDSSNLQPLADFPALNPPQPSFLPDPSFQHVSSFPDSSNLQPLANFPALNPPEPSFLPDPNADLNSTLPPLSLPWENNSSRMLCADSTYGHDGIPPYPDSQNFTPIAYNSIVQGEAAYPRSTVQDEAANPYSTIQDKVAYPSGFPTFTY
ncbi:uncharacterized protein VP01_199g11 [Puccinia sorghi]|uniref:Uncharacterized protein n=1 Tax=Puccinia sorghi TaxID=27349 RepID=A0A0L6VBL1_9BASI|nr:uncharacterized protein VP01_199g11 [Puccinia sorghi]